MSVVRGGTSESITALLSKKLPTPELMRLWGEGVQFNPDFIRRTVSAFFSPPIFFFTSFTLISSSYIPVSIGCRKRCKIQKYLPKSQLEGLT